VDSRRAPKWIFLAYAAHEIAQFRVDLGSAAWIPRLPTPPRTETHTVPANDGFRANDRDGIADIWAMPIEADEDRPLECVWPDPPRRLAAQYVELMAENNRLRFKPPCASENLIRGFAVEKRIGS